MSIFSTLGTSTGMVVGGVASVGAVAVAAFVILATNEAEKPPEIGTDPVQVSTPRVDAVANSEAPVAATIEPKVAPAETVNAVPATTPETVLKTAPSVETTTVAPVGSAPVVNEATADLGIVAIDSNDVSIGGETDPAVSSKNTNSRVVASLAPANDVQPSTESVSKPKTANVGGGIGAGSVIQIDLVRIDKLGSAIVAGKASKGAEVEIYVDGNLIAQVVADSKGGFVALFDVPVSRDAQVMTMAVRDAGGNSIPTSDRVFIKGRDVVAPVPAVVETAEKILPEDDVAPQVIIATDDGIKIVQPASFEPGAPEVMSNVSLDLISYDTEGEVVLAGRGKVENHVRIYVDDAPVKTQPIAADGSWQLSLPEVDAGLYTLRIDEIDKDGKVVSRVETPFKKEEPSAVRKVAKISDPVVTRDAVNPETTPPDVKSEDVAIADVTIPKVTGEVKTVLAKIVTIQPGATLWELAETRYGQGNLYMQIFEANRDSIRDPDLIYPGQIFTIPD